MLQPFTSEEKLFNSAQEKRGCQNVNRFGELTRHCYVPSSPPLCALTHGMANFVPCETRINQSHQEKYKSSGSQANFILLKLCELQSSHCRGRIDTWEFQALQVSHPQFRPSLYLVRQIYLDANAIHDPLQASESLSAKNQIVYFLSSGHNF